MFKPVKIKEGISSNLTSFYGYYMSAIMYVIHTQNCSNTGRNSFKSHVFYSATLKSLSCHWNTHPLRLGSFKQRGVHLLLRLGSSEDRWSTLFSNLAAVFETKLVFVKSCSILTPEKSIVLENIFNSLYRDIGIYIGYLLVYKWLVSNVST